MYNYLIIPIDIHSSRNLPLLRRKQFMSKKIHKGSQNHPKIFFRQSKLDEKKLKFECKMPTSDQLFQVRVNKN